MFKSIASISSLLLLTVIVSVSPHIADSIIAYYDGDVFISRSTEEIFADFGLVIENGDQIETGIASTAVIETASGSRHKLKENTVIIFDDRPAETRISLVEGALFSKINRLAGRAYSVKTPSAVAGVRGTEFFMA